MRGGFYDIIKDFEIRMFMCALKCARGNITIAAEALGINRTTLSEKLKANKIDPAEFQPKPEVEKEVSNYVPKLERVWCDHKMMLILQALESNNWNRTKAAADLDVSLRMLRYYIKAARQKGIEIPESSYYGRGCKR
jgi:DNA-binding NtrC family response regulator